MRLDDFDYHLPESLIAQRPLASRSASRLLCLDPASGRWADRRFRDLPDLLAPGDLAVFNDTRVLAARLRGRKESGGRVEILIEEVLDRHRARARWRASKRLRAGGRVLLEDGSAAHCIACEGEMAVLGFDQPVEAVLERAGRVPLPPYIQRLDEAADRERYQTVYGRVPGAVAAPTAGLHFDRGMLARLAEGGVEEGLVTLHVGSGTFSPVREPDPRQHRMHRERVTVTPELCRQVADCRSRGGRVVAIGTTAVRALESAARSGGAGAQSGELTPLDADTDLYILPGFRFRAVDAMLTNFHLPRSTLLMLVCAFAGCEATLAAYAHAVQARYRFFSYGDAMLIGEGVADG